MKQKMKDFILTLFILLPSTNRIPTALVESALSDPAKSTKCILLTVSLEIFPIIFVLT
jgi:hypothetical protein